MPIPIERLKEAQRPLEERIVEFLTGNSGQAYSGWEIFLALEGYDRQAASLAFALISDADRQRALAPYQVVLSKLTAVGRITSAPYHGTDYFAIGR